MNTRKLRKELERKYIGVLAEISKANKDGDWMPDAGVAFDMLMHEYFAYLGLRDRTHKYEGVPSDFNWYAFGKDIKPLIKEK